jgi:hypothetical protein
MDPSHTDTRQAHVAQQASLSLEYLCRSLREFFPDLRDEEICEGMKGALEQKMSTRRRGAKSKEEDTVMFDEEESDRKDLKRKADWKSSPVIVLPVVTVEGETTPAMDGGEHHECTCDCRTGRSDEVPGDLYDFGYFSDALAADDSLSVLSERIGLTLQRRM